MEEYVDSDHQLAMDGAFPLSHSMLIDPRRERFPCCIVWTPLPVLSWLIPFIGHTGICREDGVILDFAGTNFVCVDNFAFGAVARYIQINKDKECCNTLHPSHEYQHDDTRREALTWDEGLRKSTEEFQHRSYGLFTCNRHSFVANNLNRSRFRSGGWNVVSLAALIFLKGRWVSKKAILRSFFLAICDSIRSWTCTWWHDIPVFLGPLCIPYCWLFPSWYLLFQEFDLFVAFMFFQLSNSIYVEDVFAIFIYLQNILKLVDNVWARPGYYKMLYSLCSSG